MLSDEGIIEPLELARGLKFDHNNEQFWKELLNTEYQTMKRQDLQDSLVEIATPQNFE